MSRFAESGAPKHRVTVTITAEGDTLEAALREVDMLTHRFPEWAQRDTDLDVASGLYSVRSETNAEALVGEEYTAALLAWHRGRKP